MTQTIAEPSEFNQVHSSAHETDRSVGSRTKSPARRRSAWPGRILKGLSLSFLLFDASIKVLGLVPPSEAMDKLGYPAEAFFTVGVIELVCVIACIVPRTAVLGALLMTGYLGGAVATHFRVDNPLFSHTLFPIDVASLLWAGLWLNDASLRRVLPVVRPS